MKKNFWGEKMENHVCLFFNINLISFQYDYEIHLHIQTQIVITFYTLDSNSW